MSGYRPPGIPVRSERDSAAFSPKVKMLRCSYELTRKLYRRNPVAIIVPF